MKYIKYLILAILIMVPCLVAVLIYNDKITEDAPRYYKQGNEFYERGDYANAYYNFSKINKISPLYNMSLFKQGKSAQKAGDYAKAAEKYRQYLDKEPKSIFSKTAKMNYAKSCYYAKQYEEALAMFEELQKEEEPTKSEAIYFAGLTAKKLDNKEKAEEYLKEYLNTALKEDSKHTEYILAAAEELTGIKTELTPEENKAAGIAYYQTGKYTKALEYLSRIPYEEGWDRLVLANHYAGNKVAAKKLIEEGLVTYAKYSSSDNLKSIYNIYTSYMPGSRFKNWQTMHGLIKTNNLPCEDYVLYKLAEMLPQDKALAYYAETAARFPNGDYAAEALWQVFFNKYTHGDYTGAEEIAIKHINTYKKVKSTPRMLYWAAKTFEKENKTAEAHACLSRLISKFPDDYYGLRAESLNEKRTDFWRTTPGQKLPLKNDMPEFPIMVSNIDMGDLKIINTVFSAGDKEIWLDANFNNPIVESWFERKKDKKSRSIVLARDELDKTEIKPPVISSTYKLVYPKYWSEEINTLATENNLDAYFVTALIREESYFNPSAKSVTYATGLMQLMPDTANWMLGKMNKDVSSIESLEDVETNLMLGCAYLRYLKDKFNDDMLVTAAYNGGEGSVLKWIKQYGTDDYDLFIESIPFEETRNYVKKVFRSYHMYKKIYK